MICPHCGIHFHDNWEAGIILRAGTGLAARNVTWFYRTAVCPGPDCGKVTVELGGRPASNAGGPIVAGPIGWWTVFPSGANRGPVPKEVPSEIAQDYVEACNVLPISPKASAALSRRCLQHMLRTHGYTARDLAHEIDLLLAETDPVKALPLRLRSTIDAIRGFGNFAAHPSKDRATLEIIEVEPHEAEWCLETIEEMFQHFYVGPAIANAKKAALNAKLAASGKPPAK
ncbi:DUF4145 domain-containing protein [Bradyrhizobium sp. HKCCYLS2038]|uniref:DUF4145 domain-containing protein n=1 Tax=unclassified Bradyrhizobium TaxID=2631580 RepID=UPI003EB73FB4